MKNVQCELVKDGWGDGGDLSMRHYEKARRGGNCFPRRRRSEEIAEEILYLSQRE